jgi:hypothetical protein
LFGLLVNLSAQKLIKEFYSIRVKWFAVLATILNATIAMRPRVDILTSASATLFTNYNDLGAKAGHQTACGIVSGDQAGTPETASLQKALIGKVRGDGSSNFIGS